MLQEELSDRHEHLGRAARSEGEAIEIRHHAIVVVMTITVVGVMSMLTTYLARTQP